MNASERALKKQQKLEAEYARLDGLAGFDRELAGAGKTACGVDEVGRGPLAGPVVAGAVILPDDPGIIHLLAGLNDSKKLSEKKREGLYALIDEYALAWAVGEAGNERIDEINVLQADYEAMTDAVHDLKIRPDVLLLDAVKVPQLSDYEQKSMIKGDAKSAAIAAASIMAKVTRDRFMVQAAGMYPVYGFDRNKGYGTAEHIAALREYGPCPLHRRSFIGHFVEV